MLVKSYSNTVYRGFVGLFLIVQNQNKNKEASKTDKSCSSHIMKYYTVMKKIMTFTHKINKFTGEIQSERIIPFRYSFKRGKLIYGYKSKIDVLFSQGKNCEWT